MALKLIQGKQINVNLTGSLYGTASYAINSLSASHAINSLTASYVLPLTQDVIITGSLSQGLDNIISGSYSHAEGQNTQAIGSVSHTEGINTIASGDYSHAEGANTQAIAQNSHAEGISTAAGFKAILVTSVSSGLITISNNVDYSSAFSSGKVLLSGGKIYTYNSINFNSPDFTVQLDDTSVNSTLFVVDPSIPNSPLSGYTQGFNSHAEGFASKAFGGYSHAEGAYTAATGTVSHAEGFATVASGISSHAEGFTTQAIGGYSHAEGFATVAQGTYQHVQGQYNISSSVQSAFIVGNGADDNNRSNLIYAHDSTVEVTGSLEVNGGITGSLFGTSSYAINAETASFAPNYLPLTGGTINGNVTVNGTASIAFLNVTYESASVIYSSGSNQFGDATNDTQTLIGTVIVSGSQQVTGSLNVAQGITGSLFGTASYATVSSQSLDNYWTKVGNNIFKNNSGSVSIGTSTTSKLFNIGDWFQVDTVGNIFTNYIYPQTIEGGRFINLTAESTTTKLIKYISDLSSTYDDRSLVDKGYVDLKVATSTRSFATTGSNTFIGNQTISGSLNVTQGITGSLKSPSTLTSSIASFDSTNNLIGLDTTTYPSLTELSYVKGVTTPITSSQWTTSGSDVYYDTGNVGIGINAPVSTIKLGVYNTTGTALNVKTSNSTTVPTIIQMQNNINALSQFIFTQNGATVVNNQRQNQFQLATNGAGGISFTTTAIGANSVIDFLSKGFASAAAGQLNMRIDNDGLVGIGVATPIARLNIADTTLASGSAASGSVLNLAQTWNTTGAPTSILLNINNTASGASARLIDLRVGGVSQFFVSKIGGLTAQSITGMGTVTAGNGFGFILASGTLTIKGSVVGGGLSGISYSAPNNSYVGGQTFTGGNYTLQTTGATYFHQINGIFAPTSGTATNVTSHINPTINQTGGANGTTWGVYINPTLTSAADFRAIEVTGGKIVFSSTITATGITGAQTINKISGKVNAAAASTSLVVTNSLVTTSSIVMCQLGTNDATCRITSVVEANGSFTINYVAPTNETVIKFKVIN